MTPPALRTEDLAYDLPEDRIATRPAEPRDSARMLVISRSSDTLEHRKVSDLPDYLVPGDALVMNKTAVIPARFVGKRTDSGGKVEGLFLDEPEVGTGRVMLKSNGRLRPGLVIELADGLFGFEGNTSTGTMAVNAVGGAIDFSKALSNFTVVAAILPASVKRRSKLTSRHATVTITTETEFGGDSTLDVAD